MYFFNKDYYYYKFILLHNECDSDVVDSVGFGLCPFHHAKPLDFKLFTGTKRKMFDNDGNILPWVAPLVNWSQQYTNNKQERVFSMNGTRFLYIDTVLHMYEKYNVSKNILYFRCYQHESSKCTVKGKANVLDPLNSLTLKNK